MAVSAHAAAHRVTSRQAKLSLRDAGDVIWASPSSMASTRAFARGGGRGSRGRCLAVARITYRNFHGEVSTETTQSGAAQRFARIEVHGFST
jgi:riboflavin synthase alpha subunit